MERLLAGGWLRLAIVVALRADRVVTFAEKSVPAEAHMIIIDDNIRPLCIVQSYFHKGMGKIPNVNDQADVLLDIQNSLG